jgi:hypothetical protein
MYAVQKREQKKRAVYRISVVSWAELWNLTSMLWGLKKNQIIFECTIRIDLFINLL